MVKEHLCRLGGGRSRAVTAARVAVMRLLAKESVHIRAFAPPAAEAAQERVRLPSELSPDACDAAAQHRRFRELEQEESRRSMRTAVLIDGRNLFEPERASRAGFSCVGVGSARRGD